MKPRYEPFIVWTPVGQRQYLNIDCNNAEVESIELWGEDGFVDYVRRPLTKEELNEMMYCTLAYGFSPIWYRLLRLLIVSWTKRLYPKQGTL